MRATDRRHHLAAGQLHVDTNLSWGKVGRHDEAGEGLELGRDRAVQRIEVGVELAGHAGVVADEAVEVGAHTRRCRAADAIGRRHQHVEQAAVVGLGGVDEPVRVVVDPHGNEGHSGLFAVVDLLLVGREVQVVDDQTPEASGQWHIGEYIERRHDRLAVVDLHQLGVADRLGLTVVRRGADANEGCIVDRSRSWDSHHCSGGSGRVGQLDEQAVSVEAELCSRIVVDCWQCGVRTRSSHINRVQCTGTRRRRKLGHPRIAVCDVDVLFLGELILRLALRVIRNLDVHEIVTAACERGVVGAETINAQSRGRIERSPGVETAAAEAIVTIDGGEALLELNAHQRGLEAIGVGRLGDALSGRVCQYVAVDVAGNAFAVAVCVVVGAGHRPGLGDVCVEQGAVHVGAIGVQHITSGRITWGHAIERAVHWRVQVDGQAGDAWLPVFDSGVARVELVAGGVVRNRSDDAAVLRVDPVGAVCIIGVHAPVHPTREADDGQRADVDAGAEHRGGGRLVVGLIGNASGVVEVVVRLHHEPLGHRVGALEVVVAAVVGTDCGGAAIHQRVLPLAHRQSVVGYACFAFDAAVGAAVLVDVVPLHLAVAVGVVEHVTVVLRPPLLQRQHAGVDGLTVHHGDVLDVHDVVLRLVPPCERVGAIGDVRDRERAIGIALTDPDGCVAVAKVAQREPRLVDGLVDLASGDAAPDRAGIVGQATDRGHVDLHGVNDARDLAGRAAVDSVRVRVVETIGVVR